MFFFAFSPSLDMTMTDKLTMDDILPLPLIKKSPHRLSVSILHSNCWKTMKAVVITETGGADVLKSPEVEDPEIEDDKVLIRVAAAALNLGDTFQRRGLYPPPKGSSPYPGLECSRTIESVGRNVRRWRVGDQVGEYRNILILLYSFCIVCSFLLFITGQQSHPVI